MRTIFRTLFVLKFFICGMRHNINYKVCHLISKWIKEAKSNREFALNHNIDEKMVRKILDTEEYHLRLETVAIICEARKITLSSFFKMIEESN